MVVRVLWVLAAAVLALATVLVVNTPGAKRHGIETRPAPPIAIETSAAERLAQAIRFRTVSYQDREGVDPRPFRDLHEFLQRSYPRVHRTLTQEVVSDLSLLYTWPGRQARLQPVLLLAHLDVVPVEAEQEKWTYPPFAGRIADGYVWGRGAMDDKASVLGILEAVEFLLAEGFTPERTVYIAFGHDEEGLGGTQGAGEIAKRLRSRGVRLAWVLDEGLAVTHGIMPGVATPIAVVGVAEKGRLTLEFIAKAPGGHASMPPAETAIGVLGRALDRLEATPLSARLTGVVRQLFESVAPEMAFGRRLVVANLWLFEPLVKRQLAARPTTNALIRTTTALTVVAGGSKENVLPSEAKALGNFRILPGDTVASVHAHAERVVGTVAPRCQKDDTGPCIGIRRIRATEPSPVADVDSPSYRALAATIRQVFPDAVVAPGLSIGRTDSEHFVPLAEAAYRFLPLRLTREDVGRIHGSNERIAVENYAEMIRFYLQLLRSSASTRAP